MITFVKKYRFALVCSHICLYISGVFYPYRAIAQGVIVEYGELSFVALYGVRIVLCIFAATSILFAILLASTKTKLLRLERTYAQESIQIQTYIGRVCLALKDEMVDQIDCIAKTNRFSESKQNALEKMNEAVDISEELLIRKVKETRVF